MKRPNFSLRALLLLTLLFGSVGGLALPRAVEVFNAWWNGPPVVPAYANKVYYVILDGGALGDRVYRMPVTGNETVLDALAQVDGLTHLHRKKIWISRPGGGFKRDQILPVNWEEITNERAPAATNYQVLAGDRVFVADSTAGSKH